MAYTIKQRFGWYEIVDSADERVARVSSFRINAETELVSVDGPNITPPDMARAIAEAMLAQAADIEADVAGVR